MLDIKLIKSAKKTIIKIMNFFGTYYEGLRLKSKLRRTSYIRIKMKTHKIKPTEAELEILKILWDKTSASVKEINEELNKLKPVGYTTTLKLMQIMHEKGLLSRVANGRSHIYSPEIKEKETKNFMMRKMMDSLFGGSAKELVMQALGNEKPNKEELEEIRELIEKMEKE